MHITHPLKTYGLFTSHSQSVKTHEKTTKQLVADGPEHRSLLGALELEERL